MRTLPLVVLSAALALAGCNKPAPAPANATAPAPGDDKIAAVPAPVAPPATDALVGRWVGVEGMYLVVSPGTARGLYKLEMQWDLDHQGKFDGAAEGDAIAFTRDGAKLSLKPTDGAATGLKYLDGKKTCLTVRDGEGYCRD